MFKLDEAVRTWRKAMAANPSLEDGYIAELEESLRDEVEDLVRQGKSEEMAFVQVVSEMGRPDDIGLEFHKAYSTRLLGRPHWKPPRLVPALIWNSFKIAVRHLRRGAFYSLVNITGLVAGIASCLFIYIYVWDELSFDDHHRNADRIYRIAQHGEMWGEAYLKAAVPAPMAEALVRNYPEVEKAVRFRQLNPCTITHRRRSFVEKRIIFSDPDVLEIFTLPLISGDPRTALREPYTLLMSKKTAFKYFGEENPVGKTVGLNNREEYRVTGVFDDMPSQSHFHFDVVLSMRGLKESMEKTWMPHNFNTYLLLREHADPHRLEGKFPRLIRDNLFAELKIRAGDAEWEKTECMIRNGDYRMGYFLQPLREIHLHSDLNMELEPNGDIKHVRIFSMIAVFILIMAAFNFINLSTARSTIREREVGLRKTAGASRGQLIRQFMLESLVYFVAALILALLLVHVSLPVFNQVAGKELTRSQLISGRNLLAALLITFASCLAGGIYPALFLSRLRPGPIDKGHFKCGIQGRNLRRLLVGFQFSVSIVLIAWTLSVFSQLHFISRKNHGFDKDQVLILENTHLLGDRTEEFKLEVLDTGLVKEAAVSGFLPILPSSRNRIPILPDGNITIGGSFEAQGWLVDKDYIPTLGMTISRGRNFSERFSTDDSAVIINQRTAERLGWVDPIGKGIGVPFSRQGDIRLFSIIGVVEDFHFESFRQGIDPLVLFLGRHGLRMSFRIEAQKHREVLESIRDAWSRFAPDQPFEYAFLDDRIDVMYRSERTTGEIIGVFTLLAVLIGGLGLSGLAAYVSEQRTKEIGIRKVMGAGATEVVVLIVKDFIKPVAAANLIAWPLAYFAVNQWLEGFVYRIRLGVGVFLFAAVFTLIVALVTVTWQAARAAAAPPIRSLRYE